MIELPPGRLSDGDRVGHAQSRVSPHYFPGDNALSAGADSRHRLVLRRHVGLLLAQELGASLDGDVELLPAGASAEEAGADSSDYLVTRPIKRLGSLIEIQKPSRAKPLEGLTSLNHQCAAGRILPVHANPGSGTCHDA